MTNTFKFFAAIAFSWAAIEVQYTDITLKPLLPLVVPIVLWSMRKLAIFTLIKLSEIINKNS